MKTETISGIDFKRDLKEISKLIEDYVDERYLSQIYNQINTYKRQCELSPSKEIQLLRAIKPFVEGENKEKFSSVIEMITYSQMIKNMLPEDPLYMRDESWLNKENQVYDYMYQAVLALLLYYAIRWAEQYKGRNH